MQTTTTIRVSMELKQELNKLKRYRRETYEDIIRRVIEENKELLKEKNELRDKLYERDRAYEFDRHPFSHF